ncbi:ABC transporter C family member 3-like [Ziziphus jujuba]|uniref:ABC-type xenobiotic transporter n=1 Tax=Ziziphus jujuba TaxID=326968 RepID=A0ABM4AAL0_ZIZJJ|nr:ABC transporter C family member 3-like [Ziziphus jujuba]
MRAIFWFLYFFLAKIVECLSARQWFFMVQQIGVRIQAVLVAVIYNKGLTLSCQSKQEHTSGEIINFMTVDAERVGDFSWCMHDIWMAIVQIALALVILYKNLGFAAIAAFVATVLIMLLTAPLANLQENYQEKLMESKDRRMKATSEILRNIRILKLQAWEMKFLSRIIELRKSEENWLKKLVYTSSMTTFVFWCAPTFVSVVTFGACILFGTPLESGKILTALATFRILQEPIFELPGAISMIAQTKVSLDRIASFLSLDGLQPNVIEKLPRGSSDLAIEIFDGTFSWDLSSPNATLKHINFRVSHGMKVAICGNVGSGKSSLLSCILGEVPKISGTLKLCGTKAYVPQSPWIQSGKIEENILFGKEMDREWYERVLQACSLNKDLEILSFGDQTVIGERGINLSGGQKQRIQIARALYQDADIYLFDDPFSAVDVHTGSHLFKECLLRLLSFKTVIYVTHQLEFLPAADLILVMKDGVITQYGKYNDLLNSGADFMELVGAHKKALSTINSLEARTVENISLYTKDICFTSTNEVMEKVENKYAQNNKTYGVVPEGQLVQEEEREKGGVGLSVYCKYLTLSNGGALVPCIFLAQVCFQILQIGSNYWMVWATPISKDIEPVVGEATLMLVYFALAIGSSFCILTRVTLLATAGYKTATLLFNKMHHCIFHAPMSFFDATPSGRILNRVSEFYVYAHCFNLSVVTTVSLMRL